MGFLTRPFEEFDLDCRICSSGENASTALSCPFLSPVPISYLTLHLQSAPTICYNLPVPVTQENTQEIFFCALFFALETSSDSALAQSTELLPSSQLCRAAKHHETIGLLLFLSFHTNINI